MWSQSFCNSAAKLGIVGLSQSIALDMARAVAKFQCAIEGVTFRVTYSAWRGAVRDPDTGEPLVLF